MHTETFCFMIINGFRIVAQVGIKTIFELFINIYQVINWAHYLLI